ncbi:hypothetical protein [Streptomyces sp. 5-6(2022)]|uniref:hypothetical protein n=1 Tax=Streptomyces sp. 5-6(2022) TaxID=2936510 RepID=UPI0023B8CF04|nr:hypothetical protein [Streptomyces sp. 5-6(2022)]
MSEYAFQASAVEAVQDQGVVSGGAGVIGVDDLDVVESISCNPSRVAAVNALRAALVWFVEPRRPRGIGSDARSRTVRPGQLRHQSNSNERWLRHSGLPTCSGTFIGRMIRALSESEGA